MEDTLRARGNPREAAIWEGLTVHVKRETTTIQGGGGDSGIPATQDHLMPVEFIEDEAPAAPAARPAARAPARTAAPARAASRTRAAAPVAPKADALTERLTKLANTLELEKFQKAAMNIDEVNDPANGDLLASVLEDGEDGFWAKARAAAE